MRAETLPEMFIEVAARHGAREALVDESVRLTHSEVLRRAAAVTHRLRDCGVVPGDRVAILLPNCWQYAVVYIGAQLAGAITVLVNTRLTGQELDHVLGDSGAAVIVTDAADGPLGTRIPPRHTARRVPAHVLVAEPDAGFAEADPRTLPGCLRAAGDVAHLLYTSGTTGRPKGSMHTHANLLANARTVRERLGAAPDERTLIAAPMFHATGVVSQFVGFFTAGACCVMVPEFKAETAVEVMVRERGPPTWASQPYPVPAERHRRSVERDGRPLGGGDRSGDALPLPVPDLRGRSAAPSRRPPLPGSESFGGPAFHSAAWRHDVDLTGKRVAVIGTGASAVQFIPAIAGRVAALTVFQRTPPWILPKTDRAFDDRHRRMAHWFPPYRWWVRERLFRIHESRVAGFVGDPHAMEATAALARRLIAKQVSDPVLRAAVTPDYTIGCKRVLISSDWYPALSLPHVDIRRGGVRELRPGAVVGDDGHETPADVLVYGTGFDTQNTVRFDVTGRDGLTLSDAWRDGNQAYLDTTVAGFPNLFFMVGPNTGLGHNSQIGMIEAQARHVVAMLRLMCRHGARTVEVRRKVQRSFNDWIDGRMADTVWQTGGCRSWYQDPRSGRNTVLWPGTAVAFRRRTRRIRAEDYLLRRP